MKALTVNRQSDMTSTPINDIPAQEDARYSSGFRGFDALLGGGFVLGECVMFAGEPGVGKSTLLTQLAYHIALSGQTALYISGEESPSQLRLRADRLNTVSPNFRVAEEVTVENIAQIIETERPRLVIADSLQMLKTTTLKQPPGSPIQMRTCLDLLIHLAKRQNFILMVIGHSTKSGLIAGLLTLQHMVDAVFFMTKEGDIRYVEAKKNRFGATQDNWQARMTPHGLEELYFVASPALSWAPFSGKGVGLNLVYWVFLPFVAIIGLSWGLVKGLFTASKT